MDTTFYKAKVIKEGTIWNNVNFLIIPLHMYSLGSNILCVPK